MKSIKYKSTEKLINLIKQYVLSYEILDYGSPSDCLGIDILEITIEESENLNWIDIQFMSIVGDVSFESTEDNDYVQHAAKFIIELLTKDIEIFKIYKGSKLSFEKYTLISKDKSNRVFYQKKYSHLFPIKKRAESVLYKYDKTTGKFIKV